MVINILLILRAFYTISLTRSMCFRVGLLHIQHQSLEIFTFGVVDVYRMVSGLSKLVENTYAAPRLCGGCEDAGSELILADCLRAGECEQNAAGPDFLEGFDVEPTVALQSVAQSIAMLSEGRRVEYDEVVGIAVHTVQILESVFSISCVAGVIGEVKCNVFVREVDGFSRTVYGMY